MIDFAVEFAITLAVMGALVWSARVIGGHLERLQEAIKGYPVDRLETLEAAHHEFIDAHVELAAKVDQLPHTWEEMHHKVRRTEERTRGAVRRAMAELEENGLESAELNEIGRQLRLEDAPGSNGSGVPDVPTGMGTVPTPQAPPDDWRARTLAYKYGGR